MCQRVLLLASTFQNENKVMYIFVYLYIVTHKIQLCYVRNWIHSCTYFEECQLSSLTIITQSAFFIYLKSVTAQVPLPYTMAILSLVSTFHYLTGPLLFDFDANNHFWVKRTSRNTHFITLFSPLTFLLSEFMWDPFLIYDRTNINLPQQESETSKECKSECY